MIYPNGVSCIYKVKGADMEDKLLETVEQMKSNEGKLLLSIYGKLPELWKGNLS